MVLVVSLLSGLGCGSSAPASEDDPPSLASVPKDFRLVLGEGGGATGRWSGYTLERDGAVLAWQGPVAETDPNRIATLSPAEVSMFWREAVEADILEADMQDAGNRTAFVEIRANGREHRVSWVPGYAPVEPPKTPIEAFYRESRSRLGQLVQ